MGNRVFSGECPICGEKHELNAKVRKNKINIKGIEIEYDEMYFSCSKFNDEESEFVSAKIFDESLLNARNEYRKKFGLLTSDEIINIRKEYGLSHQELSSSNGFKILDIDLIEKIVSYMAFSRDNLYKTILMKFLWYIDKISFERFGKTITGFVYVHEDYGALPIGHYNLIGLKNINSEEIVENGIYKIRIKPSERVNFYDLNKDIKSIIDEVLMKFNGMDTNEIVSTMHSEDEYIKTKMYEIIEFK